MKATKRKPPARKPAAVKAQRSPRKYLETSIGVIEGSRANHAKERPFNYEAAVRQFHSWAYSAASMNGNAVAGNPLRLYVRSRSTGTKLYPTRDVPLRRKAFLSGGLAHKPGSSVLKAFGDRTDYEEVVEHPTLDVLQSVNQHENGFNAAWLRIVYQQLTGNAYLHPVIGSAGVPDELWTMPAQWMWIIPDRATFVRGYVYGNTISTPQMTFDPDEVIHFKRPNPRNLFYGLGNVEVCWTQLSITNAKAVMDLATFDNMARPDYLVAIKGGATTEALDRYEATVNSKMRGVKNTGKFMAVSGDVSVMPLNWNPKDLGDTTAVIEVIASVFGVPVSKLKANQNVAGGQAEVSDGSYMKDTVHPLCVQDAEVLNAKLLPMFDIGEDAVLCYDDVVPKDQKFEVERNVQYINVGVKTIDEVRAEIGDEPIPGGDVPRYNGVPLDMMGMDAMGFGSGQGSAMPQGEVDPATGAPVAGAEAVPPNETLPEGMEAGQLETTEAMVLNGAQITAATAIVVSVSSGEQPRDSGIGQLEVLFNLTTEQAERIMGSAGTSKPTTPNPNPKEEAEQESRIAEAEARGKLPAGAGANGPPNGDKAKGRGAVRGAGGQAGTRYANSVGAELGTVRMSAEEVVAGQAGVRETPGRAGGGDDFTGGVTDGGYLIEAGLADAIRVSLSDGSLAAKCAESNSLDEFVENVLSHQAPSQTSHLFKAWEGVEHDCHSERSDDAGHGTTAGFNAEGGERLHSDFAGGREVAERGSDDGSGGGDLGRFAAKCFALHLKDAQQDLPESGSVRGFESRMDSILQKQVAEVITAMGLAASAEEAMAIALKIIASPEYRKLVAEAAEPFIGRAIDIGGKFGMDKLRSMTELPSGMGFDVSNPEVQRFINQYAVKLADGVNEFTEVRARDILGDGLAKGESIPELTKRVREWAGSVNDPARATLSRASNIARTESARAYVQGEQKAWSQSGVVSRKQWLLAPDACPFCDAAAKAFSSIPLGNAFFVKGSTLRAADGSMMKLDYEDVHGPPLHPQCRCDLVPVLETD